MAKNFLVYCIGYLIAVLVAVLVAEAIFFAPSIFPDKGKWGSFYAEFQEITSVIFIGIVYTFATALPGFIITVIIAHRKPVSSQNFYTLAGVLTSLLAHAVLAAFFNGKFLQGYWIIACSIPGGAAGGYAYYRWRNKILSA